jgi:hypothetical protein
MPSTVSCFDNEAHWADVLEGLVAERVARDARLLDWDADRLVDFVLVLLMAIRPSLIPNDRFVAATGMSPAIRQGERKVRGRSARPAAKLAYDN